MIGEGDYPANRFRYMVLALLEASGDPAAETSRP